MLGKTRHVHFVGIGGIGMSGIAELLANLDYRVSGSDQCASDATTRLRALGADVRIGHAAAHVAGADVVVYSSAIAPDNPEMVEARARRIPVIPRAEMLAELMRLRVGIAVAGAHGKTSTSSMIALVLERAGLDPTAVIGGRLSAFGSNARLGRGPLMVVEADESDRSFLKLSPSVAVMTNLDREHMDSYGSFAELEQAFVDFANKVPFHGAVVACIDDPGLAAVLPRVTRRVITCGIDAPGAEIGVSGLALHGFGSSCEVLRRAVHDDGRATSLGMLRLQVPGRHSVQNALAAIAVGLELGIDFDAIARALGEFQGAERRFQVCGVVSGVTVVDDYGHHPTEIEAVIAAARAAEPGRVVVAFQPHRYTRTALLMEEFGPALAGADEVVVTDIYAAGETPISGVTAQALAAAIDRVRAAPVRLVEDIEDVPSTLADLAQPGDLVITLGAGSIESVPGLLVAELERRHALRGGR